MSPLKICAYYVRQYDEADHLAQACADRGIELVATPERASSETLELARGCDAVLVMPSPLQDDYITTWADMGIKYVCTRSIGFDHINLDLCRELGLGASHAIYNADSVANYAITLMLMCARNIPFILDSVNIQDFTFKGKHGREISEMTVGLIGSGNIGATVARHLTGFGCKILAYDPYPNPSLEGVVEYVELSELFAQSDIISLHAPAFDSNYHLINDEAIAQMKDGVIIINTARGALVDEAALIRGLESGKVGGAGLDVIENDFEIYGKDLRNTCIAHPHFAQLRSFPNVIMTPHTAFYTLEAVHQMIDTSLDAALALESGEENRLVLVRPEAK